MISSPYDGVSRAPLRYLIALVAAADMVALGTGVILHQASALSHPMAPRLLLALGGRPAFVLPIMGIGLSGLFFFARSSSSILPGLLGLGSLFVLNEAHAALIEGPMRIFFAAGATLVGWIAGICYARFLGYSKNETTESERLAEMGAVAGLCATYLGAAVSKLLASGFSWADANNLRSIIFSQRGIPHHSPFDWYAWAVATHPSLAWTLSSLTLLIQLGSAFYPFSARNRLFFGTALLCFHLNVWFLTPILFLEAMVLLVAFSYPWPLWIARLRKRPLPAAPLPSADPPSPERVRRATLTAFAILTGLAGLFMVLPIRSYAALHHNRSSLSHPNQQTHNEPVVPPSSRPDVEAWLGNLHVGDELAGFRVEAIEGPTNHTVDVRVNRGEVHFDISIVPAGERPIPAPVSTAKYDLFYGRIVPSQNALLGEDRDRVLNALADRLARTADIPPPTGF